MSEIEKMFVHFLDSSCVPLSNDIKIDRPRYDQNTYWGRAKHFFVITNPLNLFASSSALENARNVVHKYRSKESFSFCLTEDELWEAKNLYDSAYHPDTGEKMNLIGRMSAQVPMNMMITGAMMAFYKTTPAVIFWQWFNQSFNALVNYTNRSGNAQISDKQLLSSYVLATGGALTTALTLNRAAKHAPPIVGRFVPLAAVAAANCINIPMMRSQELEKGTTIYDAHDHDLGTSKNAARSGIVQVVISRIAMATPAMVLSPIVMNHLEMRGVFKRLPMIMLPLQIGLTGFCLTFATPLACAFFKQRAEIKFSDLEPELQEEISKKLGKDTPQVLYYNKGL